MKVTPVGTAGRRVRGEQERDLLLQRNLERVLLDRGLVGAVRRRSVVEADPLAERGGGGPGDPDGLAGDAVGLGRRQAVRAGEAPRAVDEDPDAEALGLARGDALDAAGLDGDRLVDAADDANVGIARAELGGRIQGSVGEISHREGEGSRGSPRGVSVEFRIAPSDPSRLRSEDSAGPRDRLDRR